MSNAYHAEYIEALVAVALRESGWTRKAPWEAWHVEHESGVRLNRKHSAAVQSWGNDAPLTSPRFSIAPGKVYWNEEAGELHTAQQSPCRHLRLRLARAGTGESADQGDPKSWEFYVVPEPDLPKNKSISLKALKGLTAAVGIEDFAADLSAWIENELPASLAEERRTAASGHGAR